MYTWCVCVHMFYVCLYVQYIYICTPDVYVDSSGSSGGQVEAQPDQPDHPPIACWSPHPQIHIDTRSN